MDGKLWPDGFNQNSSAQESWCGLAAWRAEPVRLGHARTGNVAIGEVLHISVPGSFFWRSRSRGCFAMATLMPWADSAVGLLTVVADREAVVTLMDIAGNPANARILRALGEGRAMACTAPYDEEFHQVFEFVGLSEVMMTAQSRRRLAAREFAEAVEDVRWAFRDHSKLLTFGLPELSMPLSSLTIDVCQPI